VICNYVKTSILWPCLSASKPPWPPKNNYSLPLVPRFQGILPCLGLNSSKAQRWDLEPQDFSVFPQAWTVRDDWFGNIPMGCTLHIEIYAFALVPYTSFTHPYTSIGEIVCWAVCWIVCLSHETIGFSIIGWLHVSRIALTLCLKVQKILLSNRSGTKWLGAICLRLRLIFELNHI